MARFKGEITGRSGTATRLGTEGTGLRVAANGWRLGVEVCAYVVDGHDKFHITVTGGSTMYKRHPRYSLVVTPNRIRCEPPQSEIKHSEARKMLAAAYTRARRARGYTRAFEAVQDTTALRAIATAAYHEAIAMADLLARMLYEGVPNE